MKYKLFRILIIFFSKLIIFFCYFKSSYSIAFILFLTLKKNKLINYSSKIKKNCIVLDKSFGIDDLQSAFKNTKSNIQFYMLQRILIRKSWSKQKLLIKQIQNYQMLKFHFHELLLDRILETMDLFVDQMIKV